MNWLECVYYILLGRQSGERVNVSHCFIKTLGICEDSFTLYCVDIGDLNS
jgi:hypothetical protein